MQGELRQAERMPKRKLGSLLQRVSESREIHEINGEVVFVEKDPLDNEDDDHWDFESADNANSRSALTGIDSDCDEDASSVDKELTLDLCAPIQSLIVGNFDDVDSSDDDVLGCLNSASVVSEFGSAVEKVL